ncbi:MAG: LPS export ABC transporter periplasmic protein LptC [Candidatus Omnitrophota bacterium]
MIFKGKAVLSKRFSKQAIVLIFLSLSLSSLFFSGALALSYGKEETTGGSDQQIMDFSLSGFGDKGKKSWDLSGKSADILDDVVKLKDVIGNLYGETEDVKVVADRGDFNKTDARVHLEQNVVITTSSGSKLTTDALDWDRKNKIVSTKDTVNIKKGDMLAVGKGAVGEPDLSKVTLERDVQVEILPKKEPGKEAAVGSKIIINCDGPLEVDYGKNIATFSRNVRVDTQNSVIYSDIMFVYFAGQSKEKGAEAKKASSVPDTTSAMGNKIEKLVARGHVKIVQGENISYSDEATYTALDKKILLTGSPKLIIYSTEGMGASFGN